MTATVEEQVAWSRASALILAAEERCVFVVTGADRLSWLNGLLTCQLANRREGEAVPGLALVQKGKIASDVVVVVGKDRALVVVQRTAADALAAAFEHHLMMEDAEIRPEALAVFFVHGPGAAAVLEAARGAGALGGPFDVTGLGGAVLAMPAGSDAEAAMKRAAQAAGGGEGDSAGWERVRVLAGVPRFGVDFDETTYPQEAGLEARSVSFDKGCYLGQEVVCMLEMRGHVKRKLVSLAIPADGAPAPHTPVGDGKGGVIGEVTSAVPAGPQEARALAMVKYAFIAKGTEVAVGGVSARVV